MEYEVIRASSLALKQRAQELFAAIAPIYNAVMGWDLAGADESLPLPAAVKAQILAYDALSKGALTILPELRIIKASTEESTGEPEPDGSFLGALFAMQDIVDDIGDPGASDCLVTEAAVRGALTAADENAALAYASLDHNHDATYAGKDHAHAAVAYSDQIALSAIVSSEPEAQEGKVLLFAQKIFVEGFGNTADTRLLLHGYDPLENTAMGGAAETLTNNGVAFSDAVVKGGFGATTLFFDGASDIQIPSDNYNLGTSDFTLDLWAYPTNLATDRAIVSLCRTGILLHSMSYGQIRAYSDACGQIDTNNNIFTQNAWHHLAFCRSGQSFRFYVDGVLAGAKQSSNPVNFTTGFPLALGKDFWLGIANFMGHLTEVRLSSTSDYPSDDAFTPPALPYENATSQILKAKFSDGTIVQLASPLA